MTPECSSLKQHTFMLSQFLRSGTQALISWSSVSEFLTSQRQKGRAQGHIRNTHITCPGQCLVPQHWPWKRAMSTGTIVTSGVRSGPAGEGEGIRRDRAAPLGMRTELEAGVCGFSKQHPNMDGQHSEKPHSLTVADRTPSVMSQNPRSAQHQAGTCGNSEGDARCPASHRYPGFSIFQERASLQDSKGHPPGSIWGRVPGPTPRKEESLQPGTAGGRGPELGWSPTWQPLTQ